MKILITGQTGFLGQFLSRKLLDDGHDVIGVNSKTCDLRDPKSLRKFSNEDFDRIFHLAAWTQAGDFCLHHPGEQWIINQQINTNMLEWWASDQQQAKLITIGTSCSYDPNMELIEDNYLVGIPIDSLYTYAFTKRMMEIGLRSLSKQYGLKYLTVVPSTLYGPNYHMDGRQMHFIFDLIRKILNGKNASEKVILWGDGYQERELIYVDDFIEDLMLLDQVAENDIFNIGGNLSFNIREFAKRISDIVEYDSSQIEYDINKYVGAKSKKLNNEKLARAIGSIERTEINDGLKNTIGWFTKNQNNFTPLS